MSLFDLDERLREQIDQQVRVDALKAAIDLELDTTPEDVVSTARVFESYLRGEEPDEADGPEFEVGSGSLAGLLEHAETCENCGSHPLVLLLRAASDAKDGQTTDTPADTEPDTEGEPKQ